MSRRKGLLFLKILFSVVLLAGLLYTVNLAELWQAVREVRIGLVLLAVCLFFPTQLFGAYRWHFLLRTLGSTASYGATVRYSFLGQFSALFLPGQISGDIVRATAVAHQEQQYGQSFLSMLLDKLTVLFTISLFACMGALASPVLSPIPGLVLGSAAASAISLAGVALLATFRSERLSTGLLKGGATAPRWLAGPLKQLATVFTLPRLGLAVIAWAVLCALGLQALNTAGGFILARSMNLVIDPLDWMAVNAVVAIVQILPISLGGLGVREGAFIFLLSLYGVGASQALAFSLMTFILVALLVTLGLVVAEAIAYRWSDELYNRGNGSPRGL